MSPSVKDSMGSTGDTTNCVEVCIGRMDCGEVYVKRRSVLDLMINEMELRNYRRGLNQVKEIPLPVLFASSNPPQFKVEMEQNIDFMQIFNTTTNCARFAMNLRVALGHPLAVSFKDLPGGGVKNLHEICVFFHLDFELWRAARREK
ncbi:hypothetical protein POM88_005344 [Heracleum sosnowskyi]|uniref:Uncharacterized protein n=1 Tax=Heracleum sosnowskyi TaxID=360622 RepID=A0AAD8NDD3_9APIA|nr:hypothetical protein POM88_005344 [Heracleum sosnowskyi]